MIVLPITPKAFDALDSIFALTFSNKFFFIRGKDLNVQVWIVGLRQRCEVVPSPLSIPHPYDASKVCATRKLIDFDVQKGVPFAGEHSESTCKGGLQ